MDLYLMRHGTAAPLGTVSNSDAARPLTDDGIAESKIVGEKLRRLDIKLDMILSSPLIRAKQTAEIVAKKLRFDGSITLSPALLPGSDPEQLTDTLADAEESHSVLLVSHQPLLSYALAHLLRASPDSFDVKKGAIFRLKVGSLRHGGATLKWCCPPKLLR